MVFNPHGKGAGGLIQAEGSQGLRRAPCPKLADQDNATPFLAVSNVKITPSLRSHWVACGERWQGGPDFHFGVDSVAGNARQSTRYSVGPVHLTPKPPDYKLKKSASLSDPISRQVGDSNDKNFR